MYDGVDGFVRELGATVRECIDCGALIAGGPTRCIRCAKEGAPSNKVLHPTAFLAWVIVFVLGFMLGAEYVLYRLGGG
jgi:hypothetical protein